MNVSVKPVLLSGLTIFVVSWIFYQIGLAALGISTKQAPNPNATTNTVFNKDIAAVATKSFVTDDEQLSFVVPAQMEVAFSANYANDLADMGELAESWTFIDPQIPQNNFELLVIDVIEDGFINMLSCQLGVQVCHQLKYGPVNVNQIMIDETNDYALNVLQKDNRFYMLFSKTDNPLLDQIILPSINLNSP